MREWGQTPLNIFPIGHSPDQVWVWVKGETAPQKWARENVTHDVAGIYLRGRVYSKPDVYATVFYPWTSVESVAWYEL